MATFLIVDPDAKSETQAAGRPDLGSRWSEKRTEDRQPDYLRITLSAEYINDRLTTRRPAMLPCLVSGLTDVFQAAAETEHGMYSQPDTWLTMDDWRAVRFYSEAPRPLLPVEELICGLPPPEKDPRYCRLAPVSFDEFTKGCLRENDNDSVTGKPGFLKTRPSRLGLGAGRDRTPARREGRAKRDRRSAAETGRKMKRLIFGRAACGHPRLGGIWDEDVRRAISDQERPLTLDQNWTINRA